MKLPRTILVAATLVLPGAPQAQDATLDRRVAAITEGQVTFNFASHADACGNGESWMRVGDGSWYGEWSGSVGDNAIERCARGPVRVTITKLSGEIIRLETAVGPLRPVEDATDVGTVPARAASAWLLGLAARLDGRPARDAILPAVIADSTSPTAGLLVIARDRDRARETRRSAISWLARAPETSVAEATRALQSLAADERDAPAVRQSAVAALARLPQGAGIAPLTTLAGNREDLWLGKEATRVLARSGDPRARAFLRRAVGDARLPEELRMAAITGLGGELATGADARQLREVYRTLAGSRAKDALLAAVSSVGGSVNAEWLLGVATDRDEALSLRRRAATLAERAGASGAQLATLFDAATETELRLTVIAALAQEGSKPARDKLIAVAGSTEIASVRRRAISALERFDGEEVREALSALAVP
jgi:hypothetical protein